MSSDSDLNLYSTYRRHFPALDQVLLTTDTGVAYT